MGLVLASGGGEREGEMLGGTRGETKSTGNRSGEKERVVGMAR